MTPAQLDILVEEDVRMTTPSQDGSAVNVEQGTADDLRSLAALAKKGRA